MTFGGQTPDGKGTGTMIATRPTSTELRRWAEQQEEERSKSLVLLEAGREVSKKTWLFVPDILPGQPLTVDQSVFLSYRSPDAALARECAEAFSERGFTASYYNPAWPWTDPIGELGLRLALVQALVRVGGTRASSPWTEAEVSYARSMGVALFDCASTSDVEALAGRVRTAVRRDRQPIGGFEARQLEIMKELLAATERKKRPEPTYGDLGARLMEEESRLRQCFWEPLRMEHTHPSNGENRVIHRDFPSVDDAWMQSWLILDLYSASHFFLEGDLAEQPIGRAARRRSERTAGLWGWLRRQWSPP